MMRAGAIWIAFAGVALAQTAPNQIRRLVEPSLQSPDVVASELRRYILKQAPQLFVPASAAEWTKEAARLRRHLLDNVVFNGWPREWVDAPLRVEDLGLIPSGAGYRTRKLRYEIVPGMWTSAILYEPENAVKAPGILNVNGHVGPSGKAIEYKQKRCIQQAKLGIYSLSLEWFAFGDMAHVENAHWYGAHLDLAGANGVGLFYLAMRKGLDYLDSHPKVDRKRLGVTGLSGGGWQTIVLSALDERVAVSVPVAGYSALTSRIERPEDTGDIEQNPTDFLLGQDYTHLTAMRAPRPTLLIYNAEDDCCFRAPLVKPYIFDAVRPFFRLYGVESAIAWHENADPGDHNYQLDNRVQSYRFFAKHFGMPDVAGESQLGADVKTVEDLRVPLPKDNLTILGVARKLSARPRSTATLAETVRYREAELAHAWVIAGTKSKGFESQSLRFEFRDGLSAAGVLFRALSAPESALATIVLNDAGKKSSYAEVSERVNRGERVLALDLLFTGDGAPAKPGPSAYTQMLATTGRRPLGMEAAHLIAIAKWLGGKRRVRVETTGMRSQVTALVAAALDAGGMGELVARNGIGSLTSLLESPVEYQAAPGLFCFGLLRDYDLDRLRGMAATASRP